MEAIGCLLFFEQMILVVKLTPQFLVPAGGNQERVGLMFKFVTPFEHVEDAVEVNRPGNLGGPSV